MIVYSYEGNPRKYKSTPFRLETSIARDMELYQIPPGTKIIYHKGDFEDNPWRETPGAIKNPTLNDALKDVDMTTPEGLENARQIAQEFNTTQNGKSSESTPKESTSEEQQIPGKKESVSKDSKTTGRKNAGSTTTRTRGTSTGKSRGVTANGK
jgi:hypothetical protein